MSCRACDKSQVRSLNVPALRRSRSPGRPSRAASLQFFSFCCVDQTVDEVYYIFNQWFGEKGFKFFGAVCPEVPDDFVDYAFEDPGGLEEVSEEISEVPEIAHEADCQLIQTVADRASAHEELQDLLRKEEQGVTEEPRPPESEAPPDMEAVLGPEDEDCAATVPLTLVQVLKQALASKRAVFDVDSPSYEGEKACLERIRFMTPAMRQLIRHTRCEEGILSPATVENGVASSNLWNEREHLLAAARRNAQLSRARVSRFQMWSESQRKLCKRVAELCGQPDGLTEVESYRPCCNEAAPQVLAIRDQNGMPCAALTLTVYLGAVVRACSAAQKRVRTSKPMPGPLPANATRLVHMVRLDWHEDKDEYTASCTGEIIMVQPHESSVFGELHCKVVRPSPIRVHILLTEASNDAMKLLIDEGEDLPQLPPGDPSLEDEEEETALQAGAVETGGVATVEHFTDRSFMRANLEPALTKFFRGLVLLHKNAGHPFVDDSGMVQLSKPRSWESVLLRIPSYFLKLQGDLKGHRFSRGIYCHVVPLVPSKGAPIFRYSVFWFCMVWSRKSRQVVLYKIL